jgi:hypothetical protein
MTVDRREGIIWQLALLGDNEKSLSGMRESKMLWRD